MAGYDVELIVLCSEGYTSSLAADALRSLGLTRATDVIGGFVAWAREAGLQVVGIDNLPGSRPLEAVTLPRRCVLLFGQEGPGLSDAAREACDQLAGEYAPSAWRVQADLSALPVRARSLDAAWARHSYVHLSQRDTPAALARADLKLSLGKMTLPHMLVRVILAEQLYRAATILTGHPYHRN